MVVKIVVFLFCLIFLLQMVIAQDYKMEISTIPEEKIFEPGETIQLKITLYDANNNLISTKVSIILKDLKENTIQETEIQSNTFKDIKLNSNAMAGEAEIIAKYQNSETRESFFVSEKKLAEFKIKGEKLIVTNIGNTKYDKKIYISIGGTTGTKSPFINIGESVSYRLIAPEGEYNLRVREEGTTSPVLEIMEIKLTGTGKVIGALNDKVSKASGITGISPNENSEGELINYLKRSKFVYIFVVIIFGAMILLAIEKQYRKKAN